jgi:hypothetical protein
VAKQLNSQDPVSAISAQPKQLASAILVFAANDDNKRDLADKLSLSIPGSYPVLCKTPLGFMTDEVMLFWPLLFEQLHLKAQFPLRLRPETEQELATRLWRSHVERSPSLQTRVSESRLIRRMLDLLQLAGAAGIAIEDIPYILEQGLTESVLKSQWAVSISEEAMTEAAIIGKLLLQWRKWCLERGFLSYGIIYELYGRYLLPNPQYQNHLTHRYQGIFGDDVDDYPALTKDLADFLLNKGVFGVFTYNPDGQVRLGINADPDYLAQLSYRCEIEDLSSSSLNRGLATILEETVTELVTEPLYISSLPPSIQSIQTISRAELLRKTANVIIDAVKQGEVQPQEIAIIAPGLDEIARYTLREILSTAGVPVEPLNEQRPLISSPLVRSLLTLLGLLYQGLGRLVLRDDVAEMLVILSQNLQGLEGENQRKLIPDIDPVRSGLIADYCYHIDPEKPQLLPVTTFPRWDRLGHRATSAYNEIRAWIEKTKQTQQQRLISPILLLDQAIKRFLHTNYRSYQQLSEIRELMETAQHYWEIERRLRENEPINDPPSTAIAKFMQLLRRGTITANPRPLRRFGQSPQFVTLANIFQYRSLRSCHRWQFWLDAGSGLWDKGGAAMLSAAPLFLRNWSGRSFTPEEEFEMDQARLKRILRDLLARVGEKVFLCHSDLGVTGTEQAGPLLALVHACTEFVAEQEQEQETAIKGDK